MERVFYFGDKSPVVNPDEYLSLSGETDRIVCLSLRDIHLINAYLWPFTEWRTRFSRPFTRNQREESTLEEFTEFQLDVSDLSERIGEASVSSCADGLLAIAAAIEGWANSATSSGCCENVGSGGEGQHAPPYNPEVVDAPGEGTPPDGFDSWEQWFTNKCSVATDIVTTMRGDVGRMGTLNLVGATITSLVPALVPLLLDPVPGDEIVVIAAMLLVALGLGYTILDTISTILSTYESELICTLYNATSAEGARADFLSLFSELWVTEGGNSVVAVSAATLVASLLNSATANRLFTLDTTRELPEGDCSECEEEELTLYWYNNADSEEVLIEVAWGEEVTITPPLASNNFYYSFIKVVGPAGEDPDAFVFDVASATGYSNNGSCATQYAGPGEYGPENWDNQGFFSWRFGCQNSAQPSFTGTFLKSI